MQPYVSVRESVPRNPRWKFQCVVELYWFVPPPKRYPPPFCEPMTQNTLRMFPTCAYAPSFWKRRNSYTLLLTPP